MWLFGGAVFGAVVLAVLGLLHVYWACGGRFGMGRQLALPLANVGQFGVRPYRKVLSVQAIVRREVFDLAAPPTSATPTAPATP